MIGDQICHENVKSFACTLKATFIIMEDEKQKKALDSVDPEHPNNRDLIYFYKTGNDW